LNKQIRNKFLFVNTRRLFKFFISKSLPKIQIKYIYRKKIKFVYNIPDVVRIYARDARWTNLRFSCGIFDVVYIYPPRLSVGKLHIRIYTWRRAAAHICPPVCIELSQFRVMKLTWSVRYHIFRHVT